MDNLESNLYRENIRLAPLKLRVGAYLIDRLIIILVISSLFTDYQKKQLEEAYSTITQIYSSQYTDIRLDSNTDNSQILGKLRSSVNKSLIILLYYQLLCIGLEIIYGFLMLYFYGATLGQIVLNIKVVNIYDFDKPSLHQCMGRSIGKCLLGTTLYISFAIGFIDKWKRTLHDKLAKTIVIAK
ncbi:RDD family protein [Helicobacter muridarum]|uniref:RDD family protein n=1 Tax=Helicobacter muridarum TaxID=216 RepID=A0A099TXT9_9HELI|nr:RDD family protein [Helicobacter muridarum]TLE01135.1 RDD family protein [Helicobacter muridarum]STQ86004.1 RDD family protein [Helicobacter muridarum]